jgi:alkanesulfonate monooxygenase SsuD/methylene tetrahydromethanopterin reductase-like flavin-dependent oxidoreductase (luciferase family)
VKHALFLPIFDELADPRVVATVAADAEEAGWDGVFVWDHIGYRAPVRAVADPWVTMAAMAMVTSELALGPMITPLPRRRPVKLAREVAALDQLSDGRVVLGVGIGGDGAGELSATGEELDDRVRGEMLDEGLEVLRAAWTGEELQHRGKHYTARDLAVLPRPVQDPLPIWVAVRYGRSKPLQRAARFDGVFPIEIDHPDKLAETLAAFERPTDRPYDVAVGAQDDTDPRAYEAVGATWWMRGFSPYGITEAEVRSVLAAGPLR